VKLNKKHLPFYAAIVQTIQYAFGGFLYFSWVGIIVVGSMGALISFSTAFAASHIDTVAKGRKLSSWVAMVCIMLLSPVIIGTSLYYSLEVIQHDVWRGIVSGVWGILPDGATALAGFIAGKGMIQSDTPTKKKRTPKQSAAQVQASVGRPTNWPKKCEHCDEVLKAPQAVGGHMKKHHPELCVKKAYDVTSEISKAKV